MSSNNVWHFVWTFVWSKKCCPRKLLFRSEHGPSLELSSPHSSDDAGGFRAHLVPQHDGCICAFPASVLWLRGSYSSLVHQGQNSLNLRLPYDPVWCGVFLCIAAPCNTCSQKTHFSFSVSLWPNFLAGGKRMFLDSVYKVSIQLHMGEVMKRF